MPTDKERTEVLLTKAEEADLLRLLALLQALPRHHPLRVSRQEKIAPFLRRLARERADEIREALRREGIIEDDAK